jgi:hypothetical protein
VVIVVDITARTDAKTFNRDFSRRPGVPLARMVSVEISGPGITKNRLTPLRPAFRAIGGYRNNRSATIGAEDASETYTSGEDG